MLRKTFLILLAALLMFGAWEWLTFPDVAELQDERPERTAFMTRRQKQLRKEGRRDFIDYQWVPYEKISPYLRRAVLVSEDNEFYKHEGVDVEALKEALKKDWEAKKFTHGGSTITQQLAKNLYLSPSKNPYRKLKEYVIAREMEKALTKRRILEIYLNVVEMGETVYGAEAASRFYFLKPASDLSPSEAALLAGSLPNPRIMNPGDPNKRLKARQRIILSRMRRWGHMVEAQVLKPKPPPRPKSAPAPPPEPEAVPVIDTSVPEEPAGEPILGGGPHRKEEPERPPDPLTTTLPTPP